MEYDTPQPGAQGKTTMSKHQPGETDPNGDSQARVSIIHCNAAGGTSQRMEEHHGNRGGTHPASIEWPVDDSEQPYIIHRADFDAAGNHIDSMIHDHSPSPGALPSPQPHKKGVTSEVNTATGGFKNSTRQSDSSAAAKVKTVGSIGGPRRSS
jgi:hypothetical protein